MAVATCAAMQAGPAPIDGELALPADDKSWPVVLKDVQKPDAARDLYVNPVGESQLVAACPSGNHCDVSFVRPKMAA